MRQPWSSSAAIRRGQHCLRLLLCQEGWACRYRNTRHKASLGNAALAGVTGNECGASAAPDCSTSLPSPSCCRAWCWWMTWRRCWTLRAATRRRTPASGGQQSWQGTPSTPRSTWCSITWQQSWCTKVSEEMSSLSLSLCWLQRSGSVLSGWSTVLVWGY